MTNKRIKKKNYTEIETLFILAIRAQTFFEESSDWTPQEKIN